MMMVGSALPRIISFLAFPEIHSYQAHNDFLSSGAGKGGAYLYYDMGRPGPFVSSEPAFPLHCDSPRSC